MNDSKETKESCEGHRKRLKQRYNEGGISALADHEILELILFYALPRVDTKPRAHRLIKNFGGLYNVFSSSMESLEEFGLTASSATLIRLFGDVSSLLNRRGIAGFKTFDYEEMGEYITNELKNDKTERVIVVLLDSRNGVIDVSTVCEGTFSSSEVNVKRINELCVYKRASKVVLAHNHPSGKLQPSVADCVATDFITKFFSAIGIEVVEHYIVAGGEYIGLKKMEEMARIVGNQK